MFFILMFFYCRDIGMLIHYPRAFGSESESLV